MIKKPLCIYNGDIKEMIQGDMISGLENVTNDAQLKRSAGDINSFTEKNTPSENDIIMIEDSADGFNKKKVKKSSLVNSQEIKIAVKTTTEIIINSSTYQNDDALSVELKANGIYQYELLLMVNHQGSASAGFKARFSAPSGAAAYSFVVKNQNSNNTFISSNLNNSLILNQEAGSVTGSGDYNFLKASGIIINGSTAGSLVLQWAQNTNIAINTSVMAGSYLKLIKVN